MKINIIYYKITNQRHNSKKTIDRNDESQPTTVYKLWRVMFSLLLLFIFIFIFLFSYFFIYFLFFYFSANYFDKNLNSAVSNYIVLTTRLNFRANSSLFKILLYKKALNSTDKILELIHFIIQVITTVKQNFEQCGFE